MNGSEEKVLYNAFADDCDFWVTRIEHAINWFTIMKDFEMATGLALQPSKCKANLLGWKLNPSGRGKKAVEQLKKALPSVQVAYREDIKSVGITLSTDDFNKTGDMTKKTWETKIKKLEPFVCVMAKKNEERNVISKARKINEVLSRLWYIVLNCMPEERHTAKIQGLINRLLWNTKVSLVAKEFYTLPISKPGGVGGSPGCENKN